MPRRVALGHLAGTVNGLSTRVDGLAGTVERLSTKMDGLVGTVDRLSANLDQLAALVARGFEAVKDELRSEMREGFAAVHAVLDDHSHRLDRIERKLDSTVVRVNGHEARITALEKKRGSP